MTDLFPEHRNLPGKRLKSDRDARSRRTSRVVDRGRPIPSCTGKVRSLFEPEEKEEEDNMGKSIKRRLVIGIAAGALLLSVAAGFSADVEAGSIGRYQTNSISWCRSC